MILSFMIPSQHAPVGGIRALYEFANAMRRRSHDVNIFHFGFRQDRVRRIEEIDWFTFEPGIAHYFELTADDDVPAADFIFGYSKEIPRETGLPLVFVQGISILRPALEAQLFVQPCPQLCAARWLVAEGKRRGVPEHQLLHLPNGIDHGKFRVLTPIEQRPPQVAMCYSTHETKGAIYGIEALERARARFPEMQAVLFGTFEPVHDIPDWITYLRSPPQDVLVRDVYNGSRVFISSSVIEGFGLPSIEAMACGCAIAITDNGGSDDFARHGETALVSAPTDVDAMAENIATLLRDDDLRLRIARNGAAFAKRFDWDESARRLEAYLRLYASDPQHYQQPRRLPA